MLTQPPLHQTEYRPKDIIGRANMDMFKAYFTIASSSTNDGEFPQKRLNKEIGAEGLAFIRDILRELRTLGFYPMGFTKHGDIWWSCVFKSEVHRFRDKGLRELEGKSIAELGRIAKGKTIKSMPSLRSGDIDRERVKECPF